PCFFSFRDFSWELDPALNADRHYNVFTPELYPSLEDIMGIVTSGIDEDIDSAVLFGTLRGSVVGLRYYAGVVNNDEMVALQREPNNPYDKNAIKVNNMNGDQVGHIKKELAACLAYIMDNKLAVVEGVVPHGADNAFTMPVQLSFWGKEENKQVLLERLKMHGLKLAPPGKFSGFGFETGRTSGRGRTRYNAPSHGAIQMTTEQLKTEFDKLFEDLKEDNKTCEMEAAKAVLTPLLPHQKQALAWMILRENNNDLPPFWEERNNFFYNTIIHFAERNRPENVLGGILADDMGLGKTLTMIAVILTNFHNGKPLPLEKKINHMEKVRYLLSIPKKNEVDNVRGTLIICPVSVLSNWIDQLEQHVDPNILLNTYVYYGSERNKDLTVLSKQDIVLTTYNVLATDYGTRDNSPLHKLKWLRIVLDEGHTIRNPNAQQTKAVLDLNAQRRWILTGTPIQNSLKDLWSLLSFLKLKPFTDRLWWQRTIQRPVTMGDERGLKRLQSLIKSITLRRTKTSKVNGKPVLKLPERKVFIQHITLTDEENAVYHSVKNETKAAISRYFAEGSVLAHYADVLGALLRLRQLCCHPSLCSSVSQSSTSEEFRDILIQKMKLVLSSGSDEECAICLDSLAAPIITHCAHVFCKTCICEVIQREKEYARCPLCRNKVSSEHLIECHLEETHDEKHTKQQWASSSKVNLTFYLCVCVCLTKKTGGFEFSQESGFVFVRFDGSMNQKQRVEAIQQFQNSETGSPTVMLLSLKAGGVGLNLTAASRVFLMDPAWNPAAEDQCFDRCHRLGQKQDVIITKFIVKNSVEENMLKIQKKKRELAAGAFGTKKSSTGETKMNEIRTLMDM
uniref:Helicase like transcription factor n=1 Tax=Pseudonaja textilis TaxID=8673 RepID=A0A670YCJ5_PSETE